MNGPTLFEETQGFAPWAYVLIGALLILLVGTLTLRQTTRVDAGALTVRFGFLYTARVPLTEIAHAEAVSYRPIRDYGGWGIRGFGKRRALNTRGDQGLLVTRTDGSTLLIGSQKPRELLAALAQAGVATQDRLPAVVRDF
jgi:hypothetical protein